MLKKQKDNYEFFVTEKKFQFKQYVNDFELKRKVLEKKLKIGYSIRRIKVELYVRRTKMQFIKKNICTILSLALFIVLGSVDNAFAQADLVRTAQDKTVAVFRAVKSIIFIVGGFGLVVLAFMAIFGKLYWKKFSMLAVGLAILAAAGAIVAYATGSSEGESFNDSFSSSAPGSY